MDNINITKWFLKQLKLVSFDTYQEYINGIVRNDLYQEYIHSRHYNTDDELYYLMLHVLKTQYTSLNDFITDDATDYIFPLLFGCFMDRNKQDRLRIQHRINSNYQDLDKVKIYLQDKLKTDYCK